MMRLCTFYQATWKYVVAAAGTALALAGGSTPLVVLDAARADRAIPPVSRAPDPTGRRLAPAEGKNAQDPADQGDKPSEAETIARLQLGIARGLQNPFSA